VDECKSLPPGPPPPGVTLGLGLGQGGVGLPLEVHISLKDRNHMVGRCSFTPPRFDRDCCQRAWSPNVANHSQSLLSNSSCGGTPRARPRCGSCSRRRLNTLRLPPC